MKIKFIVLLMIIMALSFCKNENDPECECPTGTVHFNGDTLKCKSENNCNCEHGNFTGQRINGIPVTNRENLDTFDFIVNQFNEALNHSSLSTGIRQNYIKNNIKEAKVIFRYYAGPYFENNNIFVIGDDCDAGEIRYHLNFWLDELGVN